MRHTVETMKTLAEMTFVFSGWMVAIMAVFGLAMVAVHSSWRKFSCAWGTRYAAVIRDSRMQ